MIRGTTPLWVFEFPFSPNDFTELYLTVEQRDRLIFEKNISELTIEENNAMYRLTQEEALSLDENTDVLIQFKGKDMAGNICASQIISIKAKKILKEDII